MDIKEILLHLCLIKNIGPATIEKLVQSVSFITLKNIYNLTLKEIMHLAHLEENRAKLIYDGLKDMAMLESELKIIAKNNISYVSVYDNNYPAILKNIHLPPTILYTVGAPLKIEKSIAIVGSRKADAYGQNIINAILPDLIKNSWTIVSGGALGIDAMAHEVAIENNGTTIAVLGSGLLKPYPSENKNLFRRIIDNNGTIVSPFPLKMGAMAGNFPARNRIIAGLSRACLVVQAAEKSGALITAQYSLDQGKDVGAVPGAINNSLSSGCHKLISDGAAIVTCSQDVFNILNEVPKVISDNNIITKSIIKHSVKETVLLESSLEQKLLTLCSSPKSFDEISITLNIENSSLQEILFNMQLEGQIKQDISGFWISNI